MVPARDALAELKQGNRRYCAGATPAAAIDPASCREELVRGQEPLAVVLGCSDSRVPPETVFDQGVGRLFVVRVAGNFAGTTQIGSIEYAVDQLGCSLVVVLGHTFCGAIGAVLAELRHPTGVASPALRTVFDHLRPAVESLAESAGIPVNEEEFQQFYRQAVRTNIRLSISGYRSLVSGKIPQSWPGKRSRGRS